MSAPPGRAIGLNEQQRAAVEHDAGPLLILAGAGTGKTRVITHRIAHRIEHGGRDPRSILAVTFTNKAAREIRERAAHFVGEKAARATLSTFHASCARWLRVEARHLGLTSNFSIYDADDQLSLIRATAEQLRLAHDAAAARSFRERIEALKHQAVTPEQAHERLRGADGEQLATLYTAYQDTLRTHNACDFGDLVTHMVHLLESNHALRDRYRARYTTIMVDEFQDTNHAQYRLLRALAGEEHDVAVVGDDDQSIYRWRGATVENVQHFRKDYACRVIALEDNYRSTATILGAAHDVVVKLPERMEKQLRSTRSGAAEPVTVHIAANEREEAEYIARTIDTLMRGSALTYDDFAVFYRVNAQSRAFEERFRIHGIAHNVVGSTAFYERREIRDILGYLRLSINVADDLALRRVINVPSRGIGKGTLNALESFRRSHELPHLFDAVAQSERIPRLTKRARRSLAELTEIIHALGAVARDGTPEELVDTILIETDYRTFLAQNEPDSSEERIRNIEALLESARAFRADPSDHPVVAFVSSSALGAQEDPEANQTRGAVSLMTVHAAKGLEFPVVFVTGLEDKRFPLVRRGDELGPEDLAEERRLYYVAVTRAMDHLFLTAATRRRLYATESATHPSPFLLETSESWVRMSPSSVSQTIAWSQGRESAQRDEYGGHADPFAHEHVDVAYDAFDQRPWQERVAAGGDAGIPEDGVIFDDSFYPQASVDDARRWVGRRAQHSLFGTGTITHADPAGERVRLTIDFPGRGTKKVVANYVEILDE